MKHLLRICLIAATAAVTTEATAMRHIAADPGIALDAGSIATTIGEGDNTCFMTVKWNDGKGIDNIAVAVKFAQSSITPLQIAESVFNSEDWRFYKNESGAYCFDLNGDQVREGDAAAYDHNAIDGETGEWTVTAVNATVNDGDVIVMEYQPDNSPIVNIPIFYLPKDIPGVWIAPGQSFNLADATYALPLYMNLQGGQFASLSCTYYSDEEYKTRNTKVCSVAMKAADAIAGSSTATLTTSGEGRVYVAARLSYKPKDAARSQYSDYSYTPVSITEPLVPVKEIHWNLPETPFQLTHSYDLNEYITLVPDNTTYTGGLTFTSSDTKNAYVSKSKLSIRSTPGTAILTVSSTAYKDIKDEAEIRFELVNPVTSIEFVNLDPDKVLEIEFDPYKMQYNCACALMKVTPEDADIPKLALKILESSVTSEDGKVEFMMNGNTPYRTDILSTYQQNDGAYDINAWGYGEATIVFESTDGFELADGKKVQSKPLHVKIIERKLKINDDFQDGTFWLNEDWFGHSNGAINYIDADGNIHYRVYNLANYNEETPRDNRTFGCTSQYGMIFGGRLYVMSKQNHDAGDMYQNGGGRLVIADARTLKRLYSFDEIGTPDGDGRACVGVSAEKVYLGHHAGIRVLNIDNDAETPEEMFKLGKELIFGNKGGDTTPGNPGGSLYTNQVGDMVYSCGHVFAVMQDRGLHVIDTATDTHIDTLGDEYVQAVTQSSDGNIWYARNNTQTGVMSLHCVDPETLEEIDCQELPETAGTINTGWGAWRSANFFAAKNKNVLYWGNVGSGYQDDILGKGTGCIFRWEIGEPLPTGPFFELGDVPGKDAETFQSPYATMRYDDRNDRILMATTHGASYNYRYNWIYFINGTTGEIERVQEMSRYFWFPAIPIFPDKSAPQINLDKLTIPKVNLGEFFEFDLSEYIVDDDNNDRNINVSISYAPEAAAKSPSVRAAVEIAPGLSYELNGKKLRLKADKPGVHNLVLTVESNGHKVSKNLTIDAGDITTGIESAISAYANITFDGNNLIFENFEGETFRVYASDGLLQCIIDVTDNHSVTPVSLSDGMYILHSASGNTYKIVK
ncbi:MAG: DUF5074 domain-containing protein [Muribaculaceae bacterium]|nr:DUF5074 domain-containing protein [Muribaculaceae bacterium]